ncbi:MAG: hypothetical protein RBT49_03270 [Bacteroidales bacterium]|jgi:hypothetical protein|nr:hypothetical protein [Bacteroidales bacterium]
MKNLSIFVILILIFASEVMCFSYWSDGYENFSMSSAISSYPVFISDNVTKFGSNQVSYASGLFSPNAYISEAPIIEASNSIIPAGSENNIFYGVVIYETTVLYDPINHIMEVWSNNDNDRFEIRVKPSAPSITTADVLHEFGHIASLGHTADNSCVMYYSQNNVDVLSQNEINGLFSHYCPVDFVKDDAPVKLLKGINNNVKVKVNSFAKSYPASYQIDIWDNNSTASLCQKLKSQQVVSGSSETEFTLDEWNTTSFTAGNHKIKSYVNLSEDCIGDVSNNYSGKDEPMDELEVKLYDLKFRSPEYNKEYSVYAPLDFEVFGKSDDGEISILEIENIGSVEYLLENGLGSNVFPLTSTDISTNFEFTQELSSISGLSTGTYYVSVYVKDLQGELIAEIEEMPILINTRSIQIERETTDEFMVYDFENAQNPYLTGKFYHEDGIQNKDFSFFDGNNVELYDVDWCESYGSNQGVFAGVYPASLLITDDSYVWNSLKWPGSKKSSKSEMLNYSEIITPIEEDSIENTSKDFSAMTWYFDFSGGLLKLRPGLYRFHGNAYVKSSFPQTLVKMADTDTLTLFIPSWKMKTELDLRFGRDRVHFRKGDDIEICIWRPVNGLKANNTQVYLYSENKAELLSSQTISYADSLGVTTMVNFPTTSLDYGFYTIEAKEIDYTTGREVVYQNEIQVCPLYVRWENGGLWPTDWPGTDNSYWKLAQFANTDPLIKSYAMKNIYDYDTDLYPLMNTQLTSPSVTLTKPYNAFMLIYIGLERLNNIFDELLAEYTVSISVNNKATWDIIKTSTAAEWATYPWPTQLDRWCFTSAGTAIEYTNQPIFVKLSGIDTKGIPRDTVFTEGVMYDEIMIAYTKADLLEKPQNLSGQFYEAGKYTAVQLTWDHSPDYQTGRYYRLYRDGIVIADGLTSLSYLDYGTVPDKMYNYVVTLFDSYKYLDDPDYESPKAGSGINFYTGLLSPSGLVITEENPSIRLTWSPVSGASGYKVYSSTDPYGTFTENTTGTLNGEEWVAPLTESKLFYYVVAVNENKKVIKILRTSGNQVK